MAIIKPKRGNMLPRLFYGVIIGCVFGMWGGGIAVAIGGYLYWIVNLHIYQELYANISLGDLILGDVLTVGIPVGLMIGLITGLHHAIFERYGPKPLIWFVICALGTIVGIWFSGFVAGVNNQIGFILEVAFVCSMSGWLTSWLSYKITIQEFKDDSQIFKRAHILSQITGLLIISISIYGYFSFWLYLQKIPS